MSKGVACGKTKQTRKSGDGFNRRKQIRNPLYDGEWQHAVDAGWRRAFFRRGPTLPYVPNTYVIPYTGNFDDLSGLTPL